MSKEFELAVAALQHDGVIAYATEAVFGLGCDPDSEAAVQRLLAIKQRPVEKGLILIAADLAQLQDYIDLEQLTSEQLAKVEASWPGPFTWIMPARPDTPAWLTGQFDTLAVRVTAHPQVQALCRAFGKPLVSTSANLTGEEPARRLADIGELLASQLAYILPGEVGGQANPSEIKDARTGAVIRPS
ncbi:Sua5/YciO/YrdC/YwlC family protein [Aeromonas dhakensis]|uniref:Sua5/YciO/YrdC/YwlC family protein n=1 Tax=Aeromonas dhakensis TaxID=196024 RepID=UPI0003698316|nr:Sua5/YciO/YrdC/YwlC family protein [Aeromonas dhakensis]KMK91183.1 tRNA threonylcarbamoyladenosine biosynthesis protein RimN [Aeromonas enteropelogenes]QKF97854.1 Sua5/YciO/YrdC/YwlC family protein [Aeromonas hydrophila]MBQ4671224.1 tRNA threonylcarbamoyladenosine biosynthesis protein RimN [Aeromonas dhakensis]MBS4717905.1 Sua5/YciO/YrdC/YwlC family protein [Aeromonas dhakensis]WAF67696.1 Sua5/YciO/YrdC/YwlC family protein [Aeromonas dhakensis]